MISKSKCIESICSGVNMDIQYLLWLQEVRAALGTGVETFFLVISGLTQALVVVAALIYWCGDKQGGRFLLFNFSAGRLVNQLIKSVACVYRPWIRDNRIHPSEKAVAGATGYSFPSGHTQVSTSILGGILVLYHKNRKILSVICIALIILVPFSRNYLGCHTLQDVLVAMLVSGALLILSRRLFAWLRDNEDRDITMLLAGLGITAIYLIVITFKPYPMNYSGGKLLVDPAEMMADSYDAAGYFAAFVVGMFMEHRLIRFNTDGIGKKQKWVRGILGLVLFVIAYAGISPFLTSLCGELWGKFLKGFLITFTILFIVPLVFHIVEKNIGIDAD